MAERTGCPILLSLWSYVIGIVLFNPICQIFLFKSTRKLKNGLGCTGTLRTFAHPLYPSKTSSLRVWPSGFDAVRCHAKPKIQRPSQNTDFRNQKIDQLTLFLGFFLTTPSSSSTSSSLSSPSSFSPFFFLLFPLSAKPLRSLPVSVATLSTLLV